jgi:hypothetical protein
MTGALDKKNRQFLAPWVEIWYCFSERLIKPATHLSWGDARPGLGIKGRERLGNGAASH